MRLKNWLTVNSRGSARVTKSRPYLESNEISILLDVSLPDELFSKPRLEAKIDVPKEAIGQSVITTEVVDNVQEAIKSATGLDMVVRVIAPEEEEILNK